MRRRTLSLLLASLSLLALAAPAFAEELRPADELDRQYGTAAQFDAAQAAPGAPTVDSHFPSPFFYTCYASSRFGGQFSATDRNANVAQRRALRECYYYSYGDYCSADGCSLDIGFPFPFPAE